MKSSVVVNPTNSLRSRMHSKLAMKAAKKMSRTSSKQKTGRKVFHHLKMMLKLQIDPPKNRFPGNQDKSSVQNLLLFPEIKRD